MQSSPRIDELRQKFHENPRRYFAPLANEYRKAGDPEQAIAICRAHLAQQPGHMSGHVVYGQSLYDAKRTDEARVAFEKALLLDPDNAIVLRQLGDIARQRGETVEARHWYSRALDADPHDSEIAAYIAELTEPLTEGVQLDEPLVTAATDADARLDETAARAAEESPGETPWRTTPPQEKSPFVTRTMAELYAKQGYAAAALDVYRQLAIEHPDDQEIHGRIRELSGEGATPGDTADDTPAEESQTTELQTTATDEHAPELSEHGEFPPAMEDLNLEPEGQPQGESGAHFTEMELSTGDSWDTDSWGAGFSADEGIALEFDAPDTVIESPSQVEPQSVIENASAVDAVNEGAADQTGETPPPAIEEPPSELGEAETQLDEAGATSEPPEAHEDDDSHLVAYSPKPPEGQLPRYTRRGPTVREFFATLGARRPPARDAGGYFAAPAAIPAIDTDEIVAEPEVDVFGESTEPEYPLASDAFANLFPEEGIAEDDTRAAFALSGAFGAESTPAETSLARAQTPEPVQESAQETEEDIRRFREWLDGLAES